MSSEFGTGKTIFVLAIVVGCFAILWPKIFYPMLTASVKQPTPARQGVWREANAQFLAKLCYLLEEHQAMVSGAGRWTADQCAAELFHACGQNTTEKLVEGVRLGQDKTNLTQCLAQHYDLTPALVAAAAPPKIRPRSYQPQGMNPHARPERPTHLYPEMMHPALREKGRAMPQRTVDNKGRRGPLPGVRPPMGGPGGIVPPPQGKGSGAMGIIMPLYTVGIVVFFVYTIMKVLFKKGQDDDKTPKLKDFGLDPEYRKYVFAEEYLDNTEMSSKDQFRRQQREDSRSRKKYQQEQQQAETKIGEWYLPEGFLNQTDEDLDDEDMNISIGGTTIDESARETFRDRLLEGIYWNKQPKGKLRNRGQLREQLTIEDIDWNEDIYQVESKKSLCRKQHGQGGKTQIVGDPAFEAALRKEKNMFDSDDMYNDDFLQLLKSGLRCDQQNSVGNEGIEELCRIAWEHLCSKEYAQEPINCHSQQSEELYHPEDERFDISSGHYCSSKQMTDDKLSGVQSTEKLHRSESNSSWESEEDSILSSLNMGNEDLSEDVTEDPLDYEISTEDKAREQKCALKDEDEDAEKKQGDSVDNPSATCCI